MMMLKYFLPGFVACVAGSALADPSNPCNAPASAAKSLYNDLASGAGGFQCAPSPVGAGTLPTVRSNKAGTVAWWYCPMPGGKWRVNWAAATAASLNGSNLLDDAQTVLTAPNPKAAFDAITAKKVNLPMSDPSLTPVWCPFVAEMHAGVPAPVAAPASAAAP